MPPTRSTRSRSATSGASARPQRLTGTSAHAEHVVDRALAVHTLLAGGRTPADVQRRLGKSKGYVSVLGYLGAALAGLEPDDLARLRARALTPRVVWPLVTRARTDERAAVRDSLGAATTDAARENARRRARDRATVQLRAALRGHVQATAAGLTAPPHARGGRCPRTAIVPNALAWDATAWAVDPVAYARAHLAALAVAHRTFVEQAVRGVRQAGAERALAAEVVASGEVSLFRLDRMRWRALAETARAARTPAEGHALALLARAAHAFGAVEPVRPARADPVTWADVEADLAD